MFSSLSLTRMTEFNNQFSAKCTSVDLTWTNVQTDPTLPVTHGVEITLSCPADYTNKGGDKATCQDGTFVLTGQPPDCRGKQISCDLP